MDNTKLTNFYDTLKTKLAEDDHNDSEHKMIAIGKNFAAGHEHPGATLYRAKAAEEGNKLREECRKHIILDIYCNILPLDDEYKRGNVGMMKKDIDCMLQGKNMSATQYLTSCFESTNAPFVEYILRATDMIRDQFMNEANETITDAAEQDISVPEPKAPDIDKEEINAQLVDIKKDTEYETFIDKLKEKTVNKIVSDVSKIINDKKDEKSMSFDLNPDDSPKTESAFGICMDWMDAKLMKENTQLAPEFQEEMIGVAIRESVLLELDRVFGLYESNMNEFVTRVRFGKGFVCNESAVTYFNESANK